MNQYTFDTRRTKCPYCGSSDGFASVLDPKTGKVFADDVGKCHSCSVFKTPTAAGYLTDTGELIAAKGLVEAQFYSLLSLQKFGLKAGQGALVDHWTKYVGESKASDCAAKMLVMCDMWGNNAFAYADIEQRGMSIKTIRYGEDGHRDKQGIRAGSTWLSTSQISGYISPEGNVRIVRAGDGAYQLLYGQHMLAGNTKPVVVVESEKTAFVCSLVDDRMVYLASGGSQGLSLRKVSTLDKANAVSQQLRQSLAARDVIICFDNDVAGETGSSEAAEAMRMLGSRSVTIMNVGQLLADVQIPVPLDKLAKADLADIADYAYGSGDEARISVPIFDRLYQVAGGDVDVAYENAKRSYKKLSVEDYSRPEPDPSLTITDFVTNRTSILAIPSNLVMVVASAGIGKSSVIASIVARHVNPQAMAFGIDVDAPSGIVVVDTEQSSDQVAMLHKRVAKRIGIGVSDLEAAFDGAGVQWLVSNKKLSVQEQVDNLFAFVRVTDPSIVIIDQIGSLVRDVNNNDEITALRNRITVDAEENKRTWILVLHTNPTNDKARGSLGSDLYRACASVLFVRKPASEGEPLLLTTNNIDGTMPKIRAGAPVRCFFAWDHARGDFYPTTKEEAMSYDLPMLRTVIEEIFASGAMHVPLPMSEVRKSMKSIMGAAEANKAFTFMIANDMFKKQFGGKLWPDWEKLGSNPAS